MLLPDSCRSANTTCVRNDVISAIDTLPLDTLSMMSDLMHPIANIHDSCIFHLRRIQNLSILCCLLSSSQQRLK